MNRRRSRALASLALGVLSVLSSALLAEPPKPRPANADKLEDAHGLLQDGKYNEAVKAFKEADKLANGSCVECRIGLARAFNKLGAYKEVLKNIDAVLGMTAETNDLLRAYNEQGVALVALAKDDPKQLEKAEKTFRKILELSGGKANPARFNLGFTLLRMSRDEEGVAVLKEYLERDPKAASADIAKSLIANPVRARKRLVPDFELATLAGDYLTSDDLRGKVLLLDFWGTWCAPCVAAVPGLLSLSRRMKDDPFVILSISTDSDEATLREFVAKNQMTWPQVWDKQHEFTEKCQVQTFPTYVLVNHEGEIVYVVSGWGERIERELNAKVWSVVRDARKSQKQADKVK